MGYSCASWPAARRAFENSDQGGAADCDRQSPGSPTSEPCPAGSADTFADGETPQQARRAFPGHSVQGWHAGSEIIAAFHTNAGRVTLRDSACNADRNMATGNPYKHLVADLQKRGVQIEFCGATARAHDWGNAT